MLGLALGCIGMGYDDFCRCTLEEFEAVCRVWQEHSDQAYRDRWERMRILGTLSVQPHVTRRVTPQTLLPFSWDKQEPKTVVDKETREAAMARAIEKFGDHI